MIERYTPALVGMGLSAAVFGGTYALEIAEQAEQHHAIAECGQSFEAGAERTDCIKDAKDNLASHGELGILQLAATIGVVATGYMVYEATKADMKARNS